MAKIEIELPDIELEILTESCKKSFRTEADLIRGLIRRLEREKKLEFVNRLPFINTTRSNPDLEQFSELEWLRECCKRKTLSFVCRQKRRARAKESKELEAKIKTFSPKPEIEELLYSWCINNVNCSFCNKPFSSLEDITIDHIIPVTDGGSSLCSNLKPAHKPCNDEDAGVIFKRKNMINKTIYRNE
jgi:hypothetical protein